ncbi:MAG: homoserine O-succinyltransferase, partial [Oscillospiraceae bacterium]|nr:homoserine O-succinyltransferase [Oscillospiraceae bacterium]
LKTKSPFFRGFEKNFYMPHSRYTEVLEEDILKVPELEMMARSEEAGVVAVKSTNSRRFFVMGHPEYDTDTLSLEYFRDVNKGLDIAVPKNYFPNDDPKNPPVNRWRAHAQLMYSNWLNYYVYQSTPYDISSIGR